MKDIVRKQAGELQKVIDLMHIAYGTLFNVEGIYDQNDMIFPSELNEASEKITDARQLIEEYLQRL